MTSLTLAELEALDEDALDWVVTCAEGRLHQQCALSISQDGRAIIILTTGVALAALAAVIAATAMSIGVEKTAAVMVAALLALAGFSAVSTFALVSLRSHRFHHPGAIPTATLRRDGSVRSCRTMRNSWVVELETLLAENEDMLEARRRMSVWAGWSFVATPIFALVGGWLAAM